MAGRRRRSGHHRARAGQAWRTLARESAGVRGSCDDRNYEEPVARLTERRLSDPTRAMSLHHAPALNTHSGDRPRNRRHGGIASTRSANLINAPVQKSRATRDDVSPMLARFRSIPLARSTIRCFEKRIRRE